MIGKHIPTVMSSVIFLGCLQLLDPYHCAQAGITGFASTSRSAFSDDSFADPPTSSSESAKSPASDAENIDGAERKGKKPTARKRKATSSSKGNDLVDVFNSFRKERKTEEADK